METKRAELVFIPSPGLSHLVSTVETAKLLLRRHRRLAATVLLIPNPRPTDAYIQNNSSLTSSSRLRFINLPELKQPQPHNHFFFDTIDNQISNVKEAVSNLMKHSNSQVAGLVLDIFCTKFVDVAAELRLPSYLFFTASAATLGLFQHLVSLEREDRLARLGSSDAELEVPSFSVPVPARVLPAVFVDENLKPDVFLYCFSRVSEMKGIMVNTFYELETHAVEALLSDPNTPDIYPVGPALDVDGGGGVLDDDVKKWLDEQPESSVVFLCFGSMGSLDGAQVREISLALEKCGCRFLWSLRTKTAAAEVLPEGFLERTRAVGRVIGWAAQVAVLAHAAVGGFVSHCGWNSTLESVWFGVPMATFPLYAEQQLNAFYLAGEVGVAEAITLDYRMDLAGKGAPEAVGWETVAAGIRRLMAEGGSGVRRNVAEMRRKARAAVVEGGSSYNAQNLFIEDVLRNVD
ncbi:putative UDP-glucose flavonoid 3-O-glucosyltransferase 3 [Salvia miltiorrhiza]|uniref:putative UDP-glucose flavonoid 3-O-glucosyltransferase 3 n=1 Tax=Salvia miltiorrhiza TaxID=226208 RepID=UPI0025ABF5D0|nr:putative UDP-glucose flavonoid 3-O-glucosyltransferase 3 [Salvia miltiorrhiza]